MNINIENVVYLYIGVCICMLLFNCVLIFYRKTEYVYSKKHLIRYEKLVETQIEHIKKQEAIDTDIQNRLQKKLRDLRHLQEFHYAIENISEKNEQLCKTYLKECKPEFIKLAIVYRQRETMQKAYFAYLMSVYKLCEPGEQNAIVDTMRQFVFDKSAYCRENALKALYSFGDEKNIYYALKLINDNGIFHHTKLITDGLLTFSGDHDKLAELFWNNLNNFSLEMQVSFINYIRIVSDRYRENFYNLLNEKTLNKDIEINIIRYFGKYHYKPIKSILLDYLTVDNKKDWEIIAVACSVLREYKGDDTLSALIQSLNHQNWYIRHNAAESLHSLQPNYQELAVIYNGNNRYAREMLDYQRQKSRINELSISEVTGNW